MCLCLKSRAISKEFHLTTGRSRNRHDRGDLHKAEGTQRWQNLDHKSRTGKALDISGLERCQGGVSKLFCDDDVIELMSPDMSNFASGRTSLEMNCQVPESYLPGRERNPRNGRRTDCLPAHAPQRLKRGAPRHRSSVPAPPLWNGREEVRPLEALLL